MNLVDFFKRLAQRFGVMSMGQRMGLLALVGLAVAVVTVTSMWTLAPKYQYLFTDLSATDASLIVQKLKDDRIPYKLTKGGTAVMIPEEKVYEERIALTAQGLPKGGVGKGFSLFDETSFSTTEFVQKINYQRALEDELAKTIMSLEEVEYARVHIALPKESVFIEDEKPAKASIVIKPKATQRMTPAHVQGIVYLVAKSVRGLEPENISIVDITGRVLYEGQQKDDALSIASNRLEVRRALENSLETRAQDMLEKIVGPGAVIVKISADVNMDMVKSIKDTFDPEGQVTRSEELKNEFGGPSGGTSGIAGTQSNLPTGRGGPTPIPPNAQSGVSSVIRNYEVTEVKTEHIQSPGEIKRLTVSVVVDGTYKVEKDGKKTFIPRSTAELKNIENAVKQAVGFSADREDILSISTMQFAQADEGPAPTTVDKVKDFLPALLKPLVLLIVLVLVLLLVIRPIVKWVTSGVRVVGGSAAEHRALGVEERKVLEGGKDLPLLEEAMAKSEEVKNSVQGQRRLIQEIAKSDNESATAVIKTWLQEQGS